MPARRPVASSRCQLTADRGFDAVTARLDELLALGVSHVYLSPVTEAVTGSDHGYDVVDHGEVRAELGGWEGLVSLLDAAHDRGMYVVIDHVPNHTSTAEPRRNAAWWSLLAEGPHSPAGRWFDVDLAAGDGKVVLPILGEPLAAAVAAGSIRVVSGPHGPELDAAGVRLPLAEGTATGAIDSVLDAQHYALVSWRDPVRNVRRFFTIDDLVAVRVEDPEVAAAVDSIPRRLVDHPGFGGVRVDHVDGLADPGAYLAGLRSLVGDRWLVVEKILAPGEELPSAWPVDGTTGYEHARLLEHALVDRAGVERLVERWAAVTVDPRPAEEWELVARREVLAGGLAPDAARVARVAAWRTGPGDDVDPATLAAVVELSVHLGRYRTYLPDDPPGEIALRAAHAAAATARPDLAPTLDRLVTAITVPAADGDVELRTRWQQLTGPATAKGVEDRAAYRYAALASLGEVGGQLVPDDGDPVVAIHAHHAATQRAWPTTMLAGTTHDTVRSEDVRANGLALAAVADQFAELHAEWMAGPGAGRPLDAAIAWIAVQTVLTTPGLDPERLAAFLVKSAREADLATSWTAPDDTYETALGELAGDLLGWAPAAEMAAAIDPVGRRASLAMLAVRATAPGVPDLYQGSEIFRYLLVDPDNRAPPDRAELAAVIERAGRLDLAAAWAEPGAPAARAVVLRRSLAVRRARPDVFGPGAGYLPLAADDPALLAFARVDPSGAPVVVTVVGRVLGGGRAPSALVLPAGRWRHVLVDGAAPVEGELDAARALDAVPAVVLVRER